MSDTYLLKYEGIEIPVGVLTIDINKDNFAFEADPLYKGPLPAFLLYSNDLAPTEESIKMWVMGRAPEPHYEFIDALVDKAGLDKYDAYGFFKFNQGRFITDRFYTHKDINQ